MSSFQKDKFEDISQFLKAKVGRRAVFHLAGGKSVPATEILYSELKDQGGGMRYRGLRCSDPTTAGSPTTHILADAIIAIELTNVVAIPDAAAA